MSRSNEQGVGIAGRNDGVAMGKADAETAECNHFGERQVGRVGIEVALDQLQVRRERAQVVVRGLIGQVAQTEDRGEFIRRKEFLELEDEGTFL